MPALDPSKIYPLSLNLCLNLVRSLDNHTCLFHENVPSHFVARLLETVVPPQRCQHVLFCRRHNLQLEFFSALW